jgi:hypothetical protein
VLGNPPLFTELPRRLILGNRASGDADSRKPKGMKKGRSCYSPAQWCLYALGSLAVPLRRLFDRRSGPLQVLRSHHRMDLYSRVQSDEKGFRYSGDLGGVVHVKD